MRHHASVTGLPWPVPAAHLPPTSPPTAFANAASHLLLLPSSQPIPKHFKGHFKGHLQPHDASTPFKSSLLKHVPAARGFVWRQITSRRLSLLTVLVQHTVQMRSHRQVRVMSAMLQGGSDTGIWPSGLHSSRLLRAVSTALLQRHLGSQRTRGKVKSWVSPAVAFPLPASFPAGQSPAASTEHTSLLLKEKQFNLQWARCLPHSCPPAAETSSGLLWLHSTSSLPNCSNFRSIFILEDNCILGFSPASACRSNIGDLCRLRTRVAS